MLLARNAAPDRLKAIGYIEQAIVVLEEHGGDDNSDETYPMDERYWLLTSSYNTGIECLQYSFALSILHVTYIYSFS